VERSASAHRLCSRRHPIGGKEMNVVAVLVLLLGGAIIHCLWVATTVIRYEWFLAFQLKRARRNRPTSEMGDADNQ
jgi:hypothetical protein